MELRLRRASTGCAIGATWVAALFVVEAVAGAFPIVVVAEEFIFRSPGWLSTAAISLLGFYAQPALVLGLILAILVATSIVGAFWPRESSGLTPIVVLGGIGATAALLLATGAGLSLRFIGALFLAIAPPYLVGRVLSSTSDDMDRRSFLRRMGRGAVVGAGSVVGLRLVLHQFVATNPPEAAKEPLPHAISPPEGDGRFDFRDMPAAVTAPDDHYVVDINLSAPELDPESWTLDIHGAVDHPYALTYDELLDDRRQVEQTTTMVCISNRVGGDLIGTAHWTGVQLSDVLHTAVPTDGAMEVVTHAADGYSEAIPIDLIEREDILIAFGMGERTLAVEHGFPARLLIPGRYGMKMTKWLTEIEVVDGDHEAYWEERGWDERAVVNTMSYIRGVEQDGDRITIGGVAFGGLETGSEKIDGVEVSIDGGDTWHAAEVEPPLATHAWRRWRYEFEATERTEFSTVVRAIEREGTVQTEEPSNTTPGGATGWHYRRIEL